MKEQSFPIRKKLEFRLLVILPAYVIAGIIILMLYQVTFSSFKNPIMEWIYWRLDVIYFFYLCIGLSGIFCHYWRKPWDYLDEVIAATQTVYEQNSHTIELSEPLRELEQQMNQIKMSILLSQKAVKEAEDRKNELVMYLAHDIRTPLTAVIGYLSLLDEAHDKAERLETLINELFEITRYHTETVQIKKTSVDLYALLAQVIEEFYPSLSARGNRVNVSIEDNLNITGDPEKLARVFNNLLKNAAAYSDPKREKGRML